MLDRLKSLLADIGLAEEDEPEFAETDARLAAAALMVHVLAIDGEAKASERDTLHTVLRREYGLSRSETDELIEDARARDLEAVDLYGFTSVLKRSLDEAGRQRIIALLWEMVYADGKVHEFEDNVLWRISELLGVSSRDRIRLRKSVANREGD